MESLIVPLHPPPLEVSVFSINTKKEDIVRVLDFCEQAVQREDYCIHLVTFLYEVSEPVGSQGGVMTVLRILVFGMSQYVTFLMC